MTPALLRMTACIEGLTAITLALAPNIVARLLLGEVLSYPGLAVARLTGIALFALTVMAWTGREISGRSPALAAMLTYNALAAVYLAALAVETATAGPLLLPAALLHAVLGLALLLAWLRAGNED
ncbi:hypothetical protein G9X68_10810 [Rhizobium sp. WYCCWR 11279]|uniref:hypothetical protein n=1 Tax=Rhizobium changzhiense TaxID=2692317 RepID=UPI001491CB82|nr:hypothetical protein [Rhizobium changzhiense]NNU47602.1 hypothetical protein [Rhizobium changzhiense]